jgi:hypothetical protein
VGEVIDVRAEARTLHFIDQADCGAVKTAPFQSDEKQMQVPATAGRLSTPLCFAQDDNPIFIAQGDGS